jgi:hypothetical protein
MEDAKLDRIDAKLDRLQEITTEIKVTLASQHEILKDHTRRSLALEQIVEPMVVPFKTLRWIGRIFVVLASSEIAVYAIKRILK